VRKRGNRRAGIGRPSGRPLGHDKDYMAGGRVGEMPWLVCSGVSAQIITLCRRKKEPRRRRSGRAEKSDEPAHTLSQPQLP